MIFRPSLYQSYQIRKDWEDTKLIANTFIRYLLSEEGT